MSRKLKVYISGPVSGTNDSLERFAAAQKRLDGMGCAAYNPVGYNAQLPQETEYDEYMAIDIALLSICDAIYMLPGWENSKGALIEYDYAVRHGKTVFRQGPGTRIYATLKGGAANAIRPKDYYNSRK